MISLTAAGIAIAAGIVFLKSDTLSSTMAALACFGMAGLNIAVCFGL